MYTVINCLPRGCSVFQKGVIYSQTVFSFHMRLPRAQFVVIKYSPAGAPAALMGSGFSEGCSPQTEESQLPGGVISPPSGVSVLPHREHSRSSSATLRAMPWEGAGGYSRCHLAGELRSWNPGSRLSLWVISVDNIQTPGVGASCWLLDCSIQSNEKRQRRVPS